MILWNITDWEHSRSRFGLLRWFCFYFCYTAVTSQSHTFKVVHLKHSLLTLYISQQIWKCSFSIYTEFLSFIYTGFWPSLLYWYTENSLPFPQKASWLASLLCASSYSYLWPLSLLLSTEETTIYPQVVWTSLNEKCKEIEGKPLTFLPKWSENKVKSLCFF